MPQESDAAFTPDFMRTQMKVMADMDMSEQAAEMHTLFAGLVATMNMLQSEGYPDTFPALVFKPVKD